MDCVMTNIRKVIDKKGYKQCAVAERAGYTGAAFNNMLTGRRTIKAADIIRISKALEVTPNELCGWNTSPTT